METTTSTLALTTFSALVERPLIGGLSRVLEIGLDRDALSAQAREYNRDAVADSVFFAVEPVVPLVLRKAGTQLHAKWMGALCVYLSAAVAGGARRSTEARQGIELVIEPLTAELHARYEQIRLVAA
jgi:hypothetical protein